MTKRIKILTKDLNHFEFTTNERNVLETIAYGEPVLGGDAVYSARVMLGISLPISSGTNKKIEQQNNIKQNIVGSIYPNPAKDVAFLEYSLTEGHTAYLCFYDIMGVAVKEFSIKSSSNRFEFSTHDFKSGLYFYKIMLDNNELLESNRLLIIK